MDSFVGQAPTISPLAKDHAFDIRRRGRREKGKRPFKARDWSELNVHEVGNVTIVKMFPAIGQSSGYLL